MYKFRENVPEFEGLDDGRYGILDSKSPAFEIVFSAVSEISNLEKRESREIVAQVISSIGEIESEDEFLKLAEKLDGEDIDLIHQLEWSYRKTKLSEFRQLIDNCLGEDEYQDFLEENTWIFGSRYLETVDRRQLTVLSEVDFCLRTADGYFDVIEIKKPSTGLLREDESHDNLVPRADLTETIRQVEVYMDDIAKSKDRIFSDFELDFVKPRAKIIAGSNLGKKERDALREISGHHDRVEIITFDQLHQIAENLVNSDVR